MDHAGTAAGVALSRAVDPAAAADHHRAVWMDGPSLFAPPSIGASTSIVHGGQDPVHPLAQGAALAAAIRGGVVHVVPGMGQVMTSPGLPEEIAEPIRW